MNRRDFIRFVGAAGGSGILIPIGLSGCAVAPATTSARTNTSVNAPLAYGSPRPRAHAAGDGTPRMIVVFLRGAVDGLNVVVPHGDREYYLARPALQWHVPACPTVRLI